YISRSSPFGFSQNFGIFGTTNLSSTLEFKTDLFTTARARLGYAAGNLLFYGSGGFAWAREKLSTSGVFSGTSIIFGNFTTPIASSDTRWTGGRVVGGGVDYAFAPNWFARLEFLRVNLGTHNFAVDPNVSGTSLPVASRFNIARFGLNYR